VAGHAHRSGIKAGPEVLDKMGRFAQGLPHYAHRFGQEAGYAALSRGSRSIRLMKRFALLTMPLRPVHRKTHSSRRLFLS